jgi:hypothetical protein
MNKFIVFVVFISFLSCSKDPHSKNCKGYSASIYMAGYSYAQGSYEDFGQHAIFIKSKTFDTISGEWIPRPQNNNNSIILTMIDHNCVERMVLGFRNIQLDYNDTIYLNFSRLGLSKEFPTANLRYIDTDATIETYHLLEDADNWLIIDKVNADSTVVEGRFNVSFITSYEVFLNNERERWDDPNRPNILHFTNGEFRAVFRG